MKIKFYWLIVGLLSLTIAIHFIPALQYPTYHCFRIGHGHFIFNGLSDLVFVSLSLILCGWLAWLIHKERINEMMIAEKENEAKIESKRLGDLESETNLRRESEKERNRINDFIRLIDLTKHKTETITEEPSTVEEKDNTKNKSKTKTKTIKAEDLDLDKLDKLLGQYQNILSEPKND